MQFICTIFIVLLLPYVSSHYSSCLSFLDGSKCEKIQNAGEELVERVKEADSIIQDVIFRCINEVDSIISPSMQFLKNEAINVKIQSPGITPIETNKTYEIEQKLIKVATRSIQDANYKLWQLMIKASKLSLKDEAVSKAILAYSKSGIGKRSASMNSLNGIIKSIIPELKVILTSVELNLKLVAKDAFNLFADSLKQLLQGKTGINIDQTKQRLETLLSNTMSKTIDSMLEHGEIVFTEVTKTLDEIDSIVQHLKQDPHKLSEALEPAKVLVMERMEIIQTNEDDEEVEKKLVALIGTMKSTFLDIKKSVSH